MNDAQILRVVEDLHKEIKLAVELQYQRPPVDHAERVGGRGSDVSDPTADTALDGTRLRFRDCVRETGAGVAALLADLKREIDRFNSVSVDIEDHPTDGDTEPPGQSD